MDTNTVNLIGRLTAEPENIVTTGGKNVCKFNIAVNGFKENEVSFVPVTIWGAAAENVMKYCNKGKQVSVTGSLKMDQWQDKATGANRSRLYVNASNVQFLGSKDGNSTDKAVKDAWNS